MADSILRLKVESQEYDNKLKRAAEGLQKYVDECRKAGGTLEVVEQDTLDFVRAVGNMTTVSKSAKGSINEMTRAFTDLKVQYNELTNAEKSSPYGKALSSSMDQLRARIKDAKDEMRGINMELSGSKFGQFGGIIDDIGHQMGITANITELVTSNTALMTAGIGAATTAAIAAAKAFADYNAELSSQQQVTTVVTGLSGEDADKMTTAARALAKTYNVDFRQAIEAANTLMSQFGENADDTMQILRDGMQGMLQGDGNKLLQMIQRYAPAFQSAGVSASELVAVIQNSEGGIFTDENMQAIVMGIKNIREMTSATSDALAKLGIDGRQMSKQMNEGTLTVFDALKQVSAQMVDINSNSQTAGEVLKTVFGRSGVMAGINVSKAISQLNTNLASAKIQTGELGVAYSQLELANERLEGAMKEAFGYDGWNQMTVEIKTGLVTALSDVLEGVTKVKNVLSDMEPGKWFGTLAESFVTMHSELIPIVEALKFIRSFKGEETPVNQKSVDAGAKAGGLLNKLPPKQGANTPQVSDREKALQAEVNRLNELLKNKPTTKTEKTKYEAEISANDTTIQKLTSEYVSLADTIKTASGEELNAAKARQAEVQKEIAGLKARNDELHQFEAEAQGTVTVSADGSVENLTKQLKDLKQEQSRVTDWREWVEYGNKIDEVSGKIAVLTGRLPKDKQARFKITVTEENLQAVNQLRSIPKDIGIKITADASDAEAKVRDIQDAVIESKSFGIEVDDMSVLDAVREINGVELDEKTMTVTVETAEAESQLSALNGIRMTPKRIVVNADTTGAESAINGINGMAVNAKKVDVTADTTDAEAKIQDIQDAAIEGKSFGIEVDDMSVLDAVREINGVELDEKTMTVTVESAEAESQLSALNGIRMTPKRIVVNADTTGAESAINGINGMAVNAKKVDVTADTTDAEAKIQDIQDAAIEGKSFGIEVDDMSVLDAVREINGVELDEKTMTVTVESAEAESQLSALNGMRIMPKRAEVTADTGDAEASINGVNGIAMRPKEVKVTADISDANAKMEELRNRQMIGKTITVQANTEEALRMSQDILDQNKLSVSLEVVPVEPNSSVTLAAIQKIASTAREAMSNADIGSAEFGNLMEQMVDATALSNLIQTAIKSGMDTTVLRPTVEKLYSSLLSGNITTNDLQGLVDQINQFFADNPIQLDIETGKVSVNTEKEGGKSGKSGGEMKKDGALVNVMNGITGGINSMIGGIENIVGELPKGVKTVMGGIQGVMNILTAIQTIAASIEALETVGSFLGIFRNGGIVPHAAGGFVIPGDDYADRTLIAASSGELILNKAQQGAVASMLSQKEQGYGSQPYVSGEQIYLGLNNYLRRTGRGEMLTARG